MIRSGDTYAISAKASQPLYSNAPPWPGDPAWGAFLRQGTADIAGRVRLTGSDREHWDRELDALRRELASPGLGQADAISARLRLLMITAARIAADQDPRGASARTANDTFVLAVLDALEHEFPNSLPLERIARSVGRSPAHASELMRKRTGLTIGQWVSSRCPGPGSPDTLVNKAIMPRVPG